MMSLKNVYFKGLNNFKELNLDIGSLPAANVV